MKISLRTNSFGELRWFLAVLLEKTGKWPLLALLIPVFLAIYRWQILLPQTRLLDDEIFIMQQQLNTPLPLHNESQEELTETLTITEYQQVKTLFEILGQHQIYIESGNYHFSTEMNNADQPLQLTIPLRGEWLALVNAMSDISRTLPVTIKSLHVNRATPEEKSLTMTLQLTLNRGRP